MKRLFLVLGLLAILSAGCTSLVPSIVAFTANPAAINAGGTATLTWSVAGASSVFIDQGVGVLPAAGSQVVSPTVTTAYTLSASGAFGAASRTVVVIVNPTPIAINFNVNPPTLVSGGSAALIWDVEGATSASIDQGIGNVPPSGNQLVSPTATTTYTLTATGAAGTITRTVVVTVNPPIEATISVTPTVINVGQVATLYWNVTGATSVSIDQGVGNVPPSGSQRITPYSSATYTLTAESSCCTVSKSASITVGSTYPYGYPYGGMMYGYPYGMGGMMYGYPYYPYGYPYYRNRGGSTYGYPYIDIFNATPSDIPHGGTATLQWYVTGSSSVVISGVGNVASSGSITVSPAATTNYTLTASNAYGSRSAGVTVAVH